MLRNLFFSYCPWAHASPKRDALYIQSDAWSRDIYSGNAIERETTVIAMQALLQEGFLIPQLPRRRHSCCKTQLFH